MVTRVPIDKATARWARKRVCLKLADAAKLLKCDPEHLAKIEDGEEFPSATLFRAMADKYVLPEATLLGVPPVADRALPKDFRSFEGAHVEVSYETARAVRLVQARQQALEEISKIDNEIVPPILKLLSLSDDPEKEGAKFRRELGFSVVAQLGMTAQKALTLWRSRVEALGISVYVEPMGYDETRGVSIYFNDFPAIIIDQREKYHGARLFTIFHEVAHLLLRQAGISNFSRGSAVERFCNRFAAAFLMPREAIVAVFPLHKEGAIEEPTIDALEFAARKLCTTISQVALRLEELNFAKSGYYKKIKSKLNMPTPAPTAAGTGGEYRYTYLSHFGENLTRNVLAALDSGAITPVKATRILNAKTENFDDFRQTIEERKAAVVAAGEQ